MQFPERIIDSLSPRSAYMIEPVRAVDLRPLAIGSICLSDLPDQILDITGEVASIDPAPQGRVGLTLEICASNGRFMLKIVRGRARGQELRAEHHVMQLLAGTDVLVPASLALVCKEDLCYQVREYIPGATLTQVLESAGPLERLSILKQMADVLSAIHRISRPQWTWREWIDSELSLSRTNLRNGVLDLSEFASGLSPEATLGWLHANLPEPGPVCLLHGDFRPKNLLWQNGHISAVIDWSFVDVGDPGYDLAMAIEYTRDKGERTWFLHCYGCKCVDDSRLRFYGELIKFINI